MNWTDAALTPEYLRFRPHPLGKIPALPDVGKVNHPLHSHETLDRLSDEEVRQLHGAQIDDFQRDRLESIVGTRWLANSQECHYRPPRREVSSSTGQAADIAMLMVDNRPPIPYEIGGTTLRSPNAWGSPRFDISGSWTPVKGTVNSFQLALIINHVYAQLHGYRFYLENPCPTTSKGVNASVWDASTAYYKKRTELKPTMQKFLAKSDVCPELPASHRLGPFPARGAPWTKLAAIRYVVRRHQFVAYVDSDVFVPEVWQPLDPLLEMAGLTSGKWLAAAEEYPPQKRRKDFRAGLANSGVLLIAGVPIAGAQVHSEC